VQEVQSRAVEAEDVPLILSVNAGYSHLSWICSGIWNRHTASICHCEPPYHIESEPNTVCSDPM
jgi:hypothetical protein